MEKSSISVKSLVSNVKTFSILNFSLFGLLVAFLGSPFDANMKFFGIFIFVVGLSLILFTINDSVRMLVNRIEEKEKEADDLESFASHMMRCSDLSDFVKDVVDIHLKNRKSIVSYQEFFFRLVGQNGKVYELFVAEIKRVISIQKEIFERSETTNSDFNRFALALSSLNELLQKFEGTRMGDQASFFDVVGKTEGEIERGHIKIEEPAFPSGGGSFA